MIDRIINYLMFFLSGIYALLQLIIAFLSNNIPIFVAFSAIIISLFTLWYSFLKGPDIIFCKSQPTFFLKGIDKGILTQEKKIYNIINRFETRQTKLIFINNGPKSGVLKLEINFKPSDKFQNYYEDFEPQFRDVEYFKDDGTAYMQIKSRESRVIDLGLKIEFYDWKEYFKHGPISKDKICEILSGIDKNNRQRLVDFISTLKPNDFLGEISIKSYQTIRKGLFGIKIDSKKILTNKPVAFIDQDYIDFFRICLEKWSSIGPTSFVFRALKEINRDIFKGLREPLDEQFKKLLRFPNEKRELKENIWGEFRRILELYGDRLPIANFILESVKLKSRLRNLDEHVIEYNEQLRHLKENIADKKPKEQTSKVLEFSKKEFNSIKKEYKSLIAEIESLQKIIQDCFKSIPPRV